MTTETINTLAEHLAAQENLAESEKFSDRLYWRILCFEISEEMDGMEEESE